MKTKLTFIIGTIILGVAILGHSIQKEKEPTKIVKTFFEYAHLPIVKNDNKGTNEESHDIRTKVKKMRIVFQQKMQELRETSVEKTTEYDERVNNVIELHNELLKVEFAQIDAHRKELEEKYKELL